MWKIRKCSLQSWIELMTTRMIDEVLTNWTTEAGICTFKVRSFSSTYVTDTYPIFRQYSVQRFIVPTLLIGNFVCLIDQVYIPTEPQRHLRPRVPKFDILQDWNSRTDLSNGSRFLRGLFRMEIRPEIPALFASETWSTLIPPKYNVSANI